MSAVVLERRGGLRILGSGGKKGRGGARSPVEQPDSLHNTSYASLLDVICNGEAYGPVHRDAPFRDIYLDGTPVQNEDGSLNFRDVQVEVRYGTQDQEHIPGFPASSSVKSVGVEVKTTTPWVQQITNPDLSAVRVSLHWPQLMRMVEKGKKAGDRVGFKVEYAIDLAVAGGTFAEVVRSAADGKTVNGYTRTHRIDLPASTSGWRVRVRRITPEATSTAIQDKTVIQSYAEVIDGKFRFPMTALLWLKVDAEQFRAIPTRAYRWRGQIVRVPSNYDPIARTYSGVWDGTFKRAWSNNPAWVYYDILLNKLYGLSNRVDASMIDRYALYQIGVYCDQLVSDGQGGQEPRFVCNTYIQSKADALRVLNDLTSVFRGMAYWANGQVVAVADMPSDPVYTYTNANVVNRRFEYTGADITTRKTVALVSWNDPSDFYRSKVEVVNDDDGIRRYGIRKAEIKAIGCTSRGQAQRVGLYLLYTSRMETGGTAFSVGLDGVIPQPGRIIKIADENRAGRSMGGRIARVEGRRITLDRDTVAKVGDKLTANLPTGKSQTRTVSAAEGRVVTVSRTFSPIPVAGAVWAIESDDLVAQHARVISIKEREGIVFDVAAVAHHPGKFEAIDTGVRLDPLPVSVVPPRAQIAPGNVLVTAHHIFHQGTTRHSIEISWDAPDHAVFYDVQWRRDNGDWVTVPRTGTRLVEVRDVYSGGYIARVRAINALDVPSLWSYSALTEIDGIVGAPPVVAKLKADGIVFGIRLAWEFPSTPNIIERTELRYSQTPAFDESIDLGSFGYPTNQHTLMNLAAGARLYFWARLVDKNGTPGAWYPSGDGVMGQSSADASRYLEYFNGLLGEDQLAQRLVARLAGFDKSIADESAARSRALTAEATARGAAITKETTERQNAVSSLAKRVDTNTAAVGKNAAAIKAEATTRADAVRALTTRVETNAAAIGKNTAAIDTEAKTRADADGSLARRIDSQTAAVNEVSATVRKTTETVATIDGGLKATYAIRAEATRDGKIVVAGMALGSYSQPGVPVQSSVYFTAGRFALLDVSSGKVTTPFVVQGGQTFLSKAFIGEQWVESSNIKSLDANKIETANLAAKMAQIKTGYVDYANIKALAVRTANIDNLAVNTLKIADNAVSVHAAADAGPITKQPRTYSRDLSVTISLPAAAKVTILATTGSQLDYPYTAAILLNGTKIKDIQIGNNVQGGRGMMFGATTTLSRTVGAGTHTIILRQSLDLPIIAYRGDLPEYGVVVMAAMK
ncbi:DUF1983 domain-containing protein [Allopusillimonas ginsengisoli]|nr:DUF1983 domain-containing protein [Allopusillimonas ginsengisoli]